MVSLDKAIIAHIKPNRRGEHSNEHRPPFSFKLLLIPPLWGRQAKRIQNGFLDKAVKARDRAQAG